jgi:hypothetical protein
LTQSNGHIIIVIVALISLGFDIVYFYVGVSLRGMLGKSSKTVIGFILFSMGSLVVFFLLSLLGGVQPAKVVELLIGLPTGWYLLKSVKRLSSEELNCAGLSAGSQV